MANIIGISAHYHDAACCLLQDGILIAAAEEERFTRRKHEPRIPAAAMNYCLSQGGIAITDIDVMAYYEQPARKLARQLGMLLDNKCFDAQSLSRLDGRRVEQEIRERLGFEGPIQYFSHHECHAASAFYYSDFEEAAIFTADGVGEWETTSYGRGSGDDLELFESVDFPDSLGLLYSAITNYLGFEVNEGEYKVMGLAPYGRPKYVSQMSALIETQPKGQYRLNMKYFDFASSERMFTEDMAGLFQRPGRGIGEDVGEFHRDIASSLQVTLENILLEKAAYLQRETGSENLCMAGGVALNCVANRRILRESPFRRLFVQPAASDAGCCLGAAAMAWRNLPHVGTRRFKMEHTFWGPEYSREEIADVIGSAGLEALDYHGRAADLYIAVATELSKGQVVGWFQGRMEFGPRALGGRSILADPRDPDMQDRINALVKNRETFRPFAPAVLEQRAAEHFDIDHPSRFMTETCQVISTIALPAITHVDGSARVQTVNESSNPHFAGLIKAFETLTGCPILLNTSFNLKGEPIVCTPIDALVSFIRSDIDLLVLGSFVIHRATLSPASEVLFQSTAHSKSAVGHSTYTLF